MKNEATVNTFQTALENVNRKRTRNAVLILLGLAAFGVSMLFLRGVMDSDDQLQRDRERSRNQATVNAPLP
jgi:hypothetical protein